MLCIYPNIDIKASLEDLYVKVGTSIDAEVARILSLAALDVAKIERPIGRPLWVFRKAAPIKYIDY